MNLDKSLSQIEGDLNYNFIRKYDEENDALSHNLNLCKYFEMDQFKNNLTDKTDNFSTYSHNVRSLNGNRDDILQIIYYAKPLKFSVLAIQEIWCVPKTFSIPEYCKFKYITRDKKKYVAQETLANESVYQFIPHVY